MKKSILSLFLVLVLSGCSTMNKSVTIAHLNPTIETKMRADISVDMSKKISGMASNHTVLWIFDFGGPSKYADGVFASTGGLLSFGVGPDDLKAAAAYNALAGKSEVIVAPQYIVEKKNYFFYSKTTVWVSGYAGTVKKID